MIAYKKGYKYQLVEDATLSTHVLPDDNIVTDYIELNKFGVLIIRKGYASDGPSGPAFDTKNFMEGAFVHDALYQLLRQELLPAEFRDDCDQELRRVCRRQGMSAIRAWWVYHGLKVFGSPAASPRNRKEVFIA